MNKTTKFCPNNYPDKWIDEPMSRLVLDVFPIQVAAFGTLCLLSAIFYLRKDCNKNRRLRVFMTTIAAADTLLIHMFVLIYYGQFNMHKCFMLDNGRCFDNFLLCFNRFYYKHAHIIIFVANLAMAVSTWSITMMLFDHLVGVKNPFWKQSQDRTVRTAYVTVIFIMIMAVLVNSDFFFKQAIDKNIWVSRAMSTVKVFAMFLIPITAMFVYIYLISYHIQKSQKIFSNRNEVCNAATRSLSTDGLRVHRGRRSNDSQRKLRIVPRMLVFIATNYLLNNLPSVLFFLKTYITHGGQIYHQYDQDDFFKNFFIVNFCLINGKVIFYMIIIISHASRFWKFLTYVCCNLSPSPAQPVYGSLQSGEDRRKLSKTSTARSDASAAQEEHALIIRRTQSNILRKPQKSHQGKIELHHTNDSHSIHSFNMDRLTRPENSRNCISADDHV